MINRFRLRVLCACGLVAALQARAQPADKPEAVPVGASIPRWPAVVNAPADAGLPAVRSENLEILHARNPLGGFSIRVDGQPIGVGAAPALIGYMIGGELQWLNCAESSIEKPSVAIEGGRIRTTYECRDLNGGRWHVERTFRPEGLPGAIEVQTDISVDTNRAVAFLPTLVVFPGAGGFGQRKGQGLFAGLEYLENEPSSSEADVIGPAARRQVPDNLKITFPLMAIQAGGRYVALAWELQPLFSAVFDSPDRLFSSGGHLMGLLFPGSDGK